jgi:TolB-like protein/DNA-binding winged helix-turn-helix (wHTH) protein
MDALSADEIFVFEGFRLDHRAGGLFRADKNGVLVPVTIGSRALDLLTLLVSRHGDLVSKDEIMTTVWLGVIVEDSNVPTQISALRRILDRGPSQKSCIQTISGRGYRFVAPVTRPNAGRRAATSAADRAPTEAEASFQTRRRLLDVLAAPAVTRPLLHIRDHRWRGDACPPHLSIVVLPFLNLSGRPDQQFVADRVTEELATLLSRFTAMRVTSRTTAYTYQHRAIDAKQIGRELGVRFVLEGSVYRSANHLRINTQLIDAKTDARLWVERFDRDIDDLFGIQDEITTRTAVALYQELICAEASRPTEHPDAIEYILRARAARMKPLTRDNHAESISLYERAFALDPQSAQAQGWLADALAHRALDEMADEVGADLARAAELAIRAVAAAPRSAFAHAAKGRVLCAQGRYKEAILELEAATAANPSWPHLYGVLSDCKFWSGSIEDSIRLAEHAMSIRPHDGLRALWYFRIARVHLVESRTNEAIGWLERAQIANSETPAIHSWLASAYALNGEIERAASQLSEARGLSRDGRYLSLGRLQAVGSLGVPKTRALLEATYLAGLRKAGMAEE